jgi:transcriptional regulator with XRE-family HTH domain
MNVQIIQQREQIAALFLVARRKMKLSQQQVVEHTGMGIATIRRFESGEQFINLRQLLILANLYEINPLKMQP